MKKLRVLVVDDAVIDRRWVASLLTGVDDIEVTVASSGPIGLRKIAEATPDVVLLDVDMPDMDGLATLQAISESDASLPVIMLVANNESRERTALLARRRGAADVVVKPSTSAGVRQEEERFRLELVPRLRAVQASRRETQARAAAAKGAGRDPQQTAGDVRPPAGVQGAPASSTAAVASAVRRTGDACRPDILAIGSSTGGPQALATLLQALPGDLPVPVVIVQHMPSGFTARLAQQLNNKSPLHVQEARPGDLLEAGHVYLAPGDSHMLVEARGSAVALALNQERPENSCRPAVDPLFRSVARLYGSRVLAIVLTGMGRDGLRGSEEIHAAGGTILVQDEATSVVWGMPGCVARAGLAANVLPLDDLPLEITRRCRVPKRPQ